MRMSTIFNLGIAMLIVGLGLHAQPIPQRIAAITSEILAKDYEQAGVDLAGLQREIQSKMDRVSSDQRQALFRHAFDRARTASDQTALDDVNACSTAYNQGDWATALGRLTDASISVAELMRQGGTAAVFQLDKARADTPRARFPDLLRAARAAYNDKRPTETLEYAKRAISAIQQLPGSSQGLLLRQPYTLQGLAYLDLNDRANAEASLAASAIAEFRSAPPSMRLAKALLDRGATAAVLNYLERCKALWPSGADQLAAWEAAIQANQTPAFGTAASLY